MSEESKKQIEELTEEMTEFYNSSRTINSRPLSPGEISNDWRSPLSVADLGSCLNFAQLARWEKFKKELKSEAVKGDPLKSNAFNL